METAELILAEDFCTHHNIEVSFIHSLGDYGLITFIRVDEKAYLPHDELTRVEQLIRLHHDLQVNLEGLDIIANLLNKVKTMQQEICMLKNRLRFYDDSI